MREIILTFHGIGDPPAGTDAAELRYWWDESSFLLALDHISAAPSTVRLATHITFDDGNASDAKIALPGLTKRGLTASFFICAGRIRAPGYVDPTAIRDLLSAGMRIGSHGMHHRDWRKLNNTELDAEVAGARGILENICGRAINEASIPFGSYDRRVLGRLRSNGYRRAYTSDGGVVRHDSWLKARNTLDRSLQRMNILEELTAPDAFVGRLRRALVGSYKALR